jgi:hypothetical protein
LKKQITSHQINHSINPTGHLRRTVSRTAHVCDRVNNRNAAVRRSKVRAGALIPQEERETPQDGHQTLGGVRWRAA